MRWGQFHLPVTPQKTPNTTHDQSTRAATSIIRIDKNRRKFLKISKFIFNQYLNELEYQDPYASRVNDWVKESCHVQLAVVPQPQTYTHVRKVTAFLSPTILKNKKSLTKFKHDLSTTFQKSKVLEQIYPWQPS